MHRIGLAMLGAVIIVVPFLLACGGYAKLVRRDQYGGTLSLHGHQQSAMEDAQQQMAAHCRGPYTITAEEQVVTGQQTSTGSRTDYGENHNANQTRGAQTSNTPTTTSNLTEYHVTYGCGGAPAAAVAPAPAPAPAPVAAPPGQPAPAPAPGAAPAPATGATAAPAGGAQPVPQ